MRDAQNNLGEIYETGRGVEKSLPEAMQWYERAGERGLGTAQFNAGRLWAIGVGGKSDPARARAWLVQAEAKGGNTGAAGSGSGSIVNRFPWQTPAPKTLLRRSRSRKSRGKIHGCPERRIFRAWSD